MVFGGSRHRPAVLKTHGQTVTGVEGNRRYGLYGMSAVFEPQAEPLRYHRQNHRCFGYREACFLCKPAALRQTECT